MKSQDIIVKHFEYDDDDDDDDDAKSLECNQAITTKMVKVTAWKEI